MLIQVLLLISQAAASLASRPGGEGEGDVTPDDEELEEGEISPPR